MLWKKPASLCAMNKNTSIQSKAEKLAAEIKAAIASGTLKPNIASIGPKAFRYALGCSEAVAVAVIALLAA